MQCTWSLISIKVCRASCIFEWQLSISHSYFSKIFSFSKNDFWAASLSFICNESHQNHQFKFIKIFKLKFIRTLTIWFDLFFKSSICFSVLNKCRFNSEILDTVLQSLLWIKCKLFTICSTSSTTEVNMLLHVWIPEYPNKLFCCKK